MFILGEFFISSNIYLEVVSATFLLVCFRSKRGHLSNEEKCFLFHFKTSSFLRKSNFSLEKPIGSHWFKKNCFSCSVFTCVYCFFFLTMKLYKDIYSAWISHTSTDFFFFTDWRNKHLKNKIELLLFYREHFYGFSESDFRILQFYFLSS